ncbi:MAG: DUF4302 domain-containing protein [Muribaculaceae bacterium]|nr:DUF4302 domain-containing protein [Muribaculaceae bacterium]
MKKYIVLPVLAAALGLGACSNDDERIFDESAADRLESSKQTSFDALTADGGKWALEYFSNTEEPGYLFVVEFRPDKSVTFTTDHKWIGGAEKSETSMFDVITDNGIVLTFNTYNTLFHVFSDPADITGPDAPTDNGEDIDETGFGHEGDYEFMMMENDGQTIRLRGKKHALNSYVRRLPADTDVSEYLAHARAQRSQFDSKRFPTYTMTETATGKTYDITGLAAGVVSCMPTGSTNPYAQTETKAVIFTAAGMRPLTAFDCIRDDNSHFSIPEFTWGDNGLVAPGYTITAPAPASNLVRQDLTWDFQEDTFSPALQNALNKANAETMTITTAGFGSKPQFSEQAFAFKSLKGALTFSYQAKVGKVRFNYFGTVEPVDSKTVKIEFTTTDAVIDQYIQPLAPEAIEYIKIFSGEFELSNESALNPSKIHFVSKNNPEIAFTAKVK